MSARDAETGLAGKAGEECADLCCADCEHSSETGKYFDTCDHHKRDFDMSGHGPIIQDCTTRPDDCPLDPAP